MCSVCFQVLSDLPESLTVTEAELMFRAITAVWLISNVFTISSVGGTDCVELNMSSVVVMIDPALELNDQKQYYMVFLYNLTSLLQSLASSQFHMHLCARAHTHTYTLNIINIIYVPEA